jgi:hypothetical protein
VLPASRSSFFSPIEVSNLKITPDFPKFDGNIFHSAVEKSLFGPSPKKDRLKNEENQKYSKTFGIYPFQ